MTCKPGWGGVGWRNARGEGLSPAAAASVPDQGLSCASRSFNVNLRASSRCPRCAGFRAGVGVAG